MDLPRELRDLIYQCSVVLRATDNVEIPKHTVWRHSCTSDQPNVALLRVSKRVHDEAAWILYRQNNFGLSQRPPQLQSIEAALHAHASIMQHVHVSYCVLRFMKRKVEFIDHVHPRTELPAALAHLQANGNFEGFFPDKDIKLGLLEKMTELKTLTIDLDMDDCFEQNGKPWTEALDFLEACLRDLSRPLVERDPPVKFRVCVQGFFVRASEGIDALKDTSERLQFKLVDPSRDDHTGPWCWNC